MEGVQDRSFVGSSMEVGDQLHLKGFLVLEGVLVDQEDQNPKKKVSS